jgi:hypothetical protein
MSGQLHAPAALPLEKDPPASVGQKAGWAAEPVSKKRILISRLESNPDRPARSQ